MWRQEGARGGVRGHCGTEKCSLRGTRGRSVGQTEKGGGGVSVESLFNCLSALQRYYKEATIR